MEGRISDDISLKLLRDALCLSSATLRISVKVLAKLDHKCYQNSHMATRLNRIKQKNVLFITEMRFLFFHPSASQPSINFKKSKLAYRSFSLTWSAAVQICWNKRNKVFH